MNPVVHFEMPYEDSKRISDFYTQAFGWNMQQMGPEMSDYVMAGTAETDPQTHMVKEPGRINGGFFKKSPDHSTPTVVIAVDDIQESMKKVQQAGGNDLAGSKPGQPDEIPGVGLYIAFTDTEGNRIAMLQPKGM